MRGPLRTRRAARAAKAPRISPWRCATASQTTRTSWRRSRAATVAATRTGTRTGSIIISPSLGIGTGRRRRRSCILSFIRRICGGEGKGYVKAGKKGIEGAWPVSVGVDVGLAKAKFHSLGSVELAWMLDNEWRLASGRFSLVSPNRAKKVGNYVHSISQCKDYSYQLPCLVLLLRSNLWSLLLRTLQRVPSAHRKSGIVTQSIIRDADTARQNSSSKRGPRYSLFLEEVR